MGVLKNLQNLSDLEFYKCAEKLQDDIGERMGKKKTENAEVRRGEIEARIRELVSELGAPNSAVGDWKVIKCYEASLEGHELPYDITELMEARQAVRDEINELQAELETLQGAE